MVKQLKNSNNLIALGIILLVLVFGIYSTFQYTTGIRINIHDNQIAILGLRTEIIVKKFGQLNSIVPPPEIPITTFINITILDNLNQTNRTCVSLLRQTEQDAFIPCELGESGLKKIRAEVWSYNNYTTISKISEADGVFNWTK